MTSKSQLMFQLFITIEKLLECFSLIVDVVAGEDPASVEKAMDEVMESFIKKGPNRKLLQAEKTKALAGFIRGIQRIGGFGGKSDLLATCQTYTANPGCYRENAKVP